MTPIINESELLELLRTAERLEREGQEESARVVYLAATNLRHLLRHSWDTTVLVAWSKGRGRRVTWGAADDTLTEQSVQLQDDETGDTADFFGSTVDSALHSAAQSAWLLLDTNDQAWIGECP